MHCTANHIHTSLWSRFTRFKRGTYEFLTHGDLITAGNMSSVWSVMKSSHTGISLFFFAKSFLGFKLKYTDFLCFACDEERSTCGFQISLCSIATWGSISGCSVSFSCVCSPSTCPGCSFRAADHSLCRDVGPWIDISGYGSDLELFKSGRTLLTPLSKCLWARHLTPPTSAPQVPSMAAYCSVCSLCVVVPRCVHMDGLKAEDKFPPIACSVCVCMCVGLIKRYLSLTRYYLLFCYGSAANLHPSSTCLCRCDCSRPPPPPPWTQTAWDPHWRDLYQLCKMFARIHLPKAVFSFCFDLQTCCLVPWAWGCVWDDSLVPSAASGDHKFRSKMEVSQYMNFYIWEPDTRNWRQ